MGSIMDGRELAKGLRQEIKQEARFFPFSCLCMYVRGCMYIVAASN